MIVRRPSTSFISFPTPARRPHVPSPLANLLNAMHSQGIFVSLGLSLVHMKEQTKVLLLKSLLRRSHKIAQVWAPQSLVLLLWVCGWKALKLSLQARAGESQLVGKPAEAPAPGDWE